MNKEVTNEKKQYKEIIDKLKLKYSNLSTIVIYNKHNVQKASIIVDDITKLIDELDGKSLPYFNEIRLERILSSIRKLVKTFYKDTKWNRVKQLILVVWIDSLMKHL